MYLELVGTPIMLLKQLKTYWTEAIPSGMDFKCWKENVEQPKRRLTQPLTLFCSDTTVIMIFRVIFLFKPRLAPRKI